ncbi:hypothetical protein GCM10027062_10410 [Nocardioides hungaricus]
MTTPIPPATAVRATRDTRSYWRILLALSAPIGWLTVGISNALNPYPLGGSTAENVAGIAEDPDRMRALLDIAPLFLFTFVPGVIALVVVCRRTKPLFTAILGTLGILGALAGTFNPPVDMMVWLGLKNGLGQGQLVTLADAFDSSPFGWTLLFTLLFITVGRIAAGVLLWKADVGPRPLAVLMAISPVIEFGGGALGLGNGAPAAAWIASGIAMLGVSSALLRMPNDEFDLPPVSTASDDRRE